MATLLPNDRVSAADLAGYRVFIFSHDHPHPPHVHLGKGKRFSSWDIITLDCRERDGFDRTELREQKRLLQRFQAEILSAWRSHWRGHGQS